jgi:hypothetical protein
MVTFFAVYHIFDKISYRSEENEKQRQHEREMLEKEMKHTSEQVELNRQLEREKLEAAKLKSESP